MQQNLSEEVSSPSVANCVVKDLKSVSDMTTAELNGPEDVIHRPQGKTFHGKLISESRDVIICVDGTIYIGTITFATENYIHITATDLRNSKSLETKLYKNEIKFIEFLKPVDIPVDTYCDFTINELKRVSELLSGFKFIERFDRAYHDAIDDIAIEPFVGFYMPGVDMGRFSKQTIIAITTTKAIYVFDIVVLGRIEQSLKTILESNFPKKIVHNACEVADFLQHRNNVHLNGVFDTMVAHCALGFDKSKISLQECLFDHFKFPAFFVDQTPGPWHRRPLSSNQKYFAARNVVFLPKLHSHFSRLMLASIYNDPTS